MEGCEATRYNSLYLANLNNGRNNLSFLRMHPGQMRLLAPVLVLKKYCADIYYRLVPRWRIRTRVPYAAICRTPGTGTHKTRYRELSKRTVFPRDLRIAGFSGTRFSQSWQCSPSLLTEVNETGTHCASRLI
eukprot:3937825-Rhodomonas_salina.1